MADYPNMSTALSFKGELAKTGTNPFRNDKQYGIGAVLVGHRCLVFGGYSQNHSSVGIYDVVERSWKRHAMKNMRQLYGRVRMTFIVDDVLYVYSWSRDDKKCVFLMLDLVSMEDWVCGGKNPCAQMGFGTSGSYVESRNEGVLFSGKRRNFTDVWVYNVENGTWYCPQTSGTPPRARYNHTTCSEGKTMFVLGGQTTLPGNHVIRPFDLHMLTMDGKRFAWSTPEVNGYVPPERFLFAATCQARRVFVFGGYRGYSSFDIYSVEHGSWMKGSSNNEYEPYEVLQFTSGWKRGTSDHAMVLMPQELIVFGGFQLSITTPLHITPI